MSDKKNEVQVTSNNPIVNAVETRINELQKKDAIQFPPSYSPQNALLSAMLLLQGAQDRNNRPVLTECSKESIQNSLLDMVIQGLSPAKNQGYFIAYGKKLKFMRSYFGSMAVAKRMANIKEISAELVYKSDVFEFDIVDGKRVITKHTTKLDSLDEEFVAVYCIILFNDETKYTEIMTKKQVMVSWSKAKTTNVQKEFPDQMAKRTVINRACKYFINTSDDSDLLIKAFNDSGGEYEDAQITDDSGKAIETHHGKVEMEVEVESEKEEEPKPKVTKREPEKVIEREEPAEEKKVEEKPKPKVTTSELLDSQKTLLGKIETQVKNEEINQNVMNVMVEKVNNAKTMDDCYLIDSQCMLLSWISNLEQELKIPPTEIGGYITKVLGCTNLEEIKAVESDLKKLK